MYRKNLAEEIEPQPVYTDEYVKRHWREFVYGTNSHPNYYKSEQHRKDRGAFLLDKYK